MGIRNKEKKICLVANTSWYLYNFRLGLLNDLKEKNYDLTLVSPEDKYTELLKKKGFKFENWILNQDSINPINEIRSIFFLSFIIKKIKPDAVCNFTIKACLYGTIAAKFANTKRILNSITGLGHLFLGEKKRNKLLKFFIYPIYYLILNLKNSYVIFQNISDRESLLKKGIIKDYRSCLIEGSGIDSNFFKSKKKISNVYSNPVKLLFPSRLLYEKGIKELIIACNKLWALGFKFQLLLAGSIDSKSRSKIKYKDLKALKGNNNIKFLGHIDDMRELYEEVDIVVLPSWREGLSRALIEAASMEKPIITTDVPGCKDIIEHGKSGILIQEKDPRAIYFAIILLLENPELASRIGKAARQRVISKFQAEIINKKFIDKIHDI